MADDSIGERLSSLGAPGKVKETVPWPFSISGVSTNDVASL